MCAGSLLVALLGVQTWREVEEVGMSTLRKVEWCIEVKNEINRGFHLLHQEP